MPRPSSTCHVSAPSERRHTGEVEYEREGRSVRGIVDGQVGSFFAVRRHLGGETSPDKIAKLAKTVLYW